MIKSFFIGLYRSFKKNKVSSTIMFFNLIVGYVVFISLFLIVNGEFNYDTYNKNYDRIYSVQIKQEDIYPTNYVVTVPPIVRYEVFNDMPEVETYLMMLSLSSNFFTMKDGNQIRQTNGYYSENTIFDIFSIDVIQGDPQNALTRPNTIAISESFANRLFPDGNAVGSHLVIEKKITAEVTLVYKDFPGRSNIRPEYLLSFATYESLNPDFRNGYGWSYNFFVLLKPGANYKAINKKIATVLYERMNAKNAAYLYPISLHHISPNNQRDIIICMEILTMAAYLILILSYVNFTNLTLANSTLRAKEIGIKKVSGCSKKLLATQFIAESLLVTYISMIIGLLITTLLLPYLNYILPTSSKVSMDYDLWSNTKLLSIVFLSGTVIGTLAGCYPAFVMSSYNPVKILKGKIFSNVEKKISLKKILLVVQFNISISMSLIGILMSRQVDFMTNSDLGFDSKNLVYTEIDFKNTADFELIRQQLKQNPNIVDASYSKTIPYYNNMGGRYTWEGCQDGDKIDCSCNYVSYGYLNTFDLKIIEGRNFSPEFPSDKSSACLVNETALKAMNMKDPLGKKINWYGTKYTIVGVVKDYHPFSIHNPIPPFVFFLNDNELGHEWALLTIRYTPGNGDAAKQSATKELSEMFPDEPFVLSNFNTLFDIDLAIFFYRTIKIVFIYFSIISIIMSALGLFAIMSFSIKRRMKEIGIRKTLGSSGLQIFITLSSGIFILFGIAVVLAFLPTLGVSNAMPGATKVSLEVIDYLICIGAVLITILLTIGYHIYQAVKSNPVDSLKYE